MMNRQECLDFAREGAYQARSLDLAQVVVTAEDVKSATEEVEKDIRKNFRVANWANRFLSTAGLAIAAGTGVFCCLLNNYLGRPVYGGLDIAVCFAAVLALVWISVSKCADFDSDVLMLQELQPIAGTDACKDALKLVQAGHPEVLAWRDLAIAERGQLHMFDVEVMRCLNHRATAVQEQEQAARNWEAREQARKRELEEACRIVHGI